MTARKAALKAAEKVNKSADYTASAGCYTGGANGVYWLSILAKRPDNLIAVGNMHDVGKREVKSIQAVIEPDLVYPLLRGRDVSHWSAAPSAFLLVAQDPAKRMGYPETWLKTHLPYTYSYLKEFEETLWERKSRVVRDLMEKSAFYAMYAVADYTFARFKVVWKYIASEFTCAVAGSLNDGHLGEKVIVPDHRLMLIPCDSQMEAHFACGLLNSSISRFMVKSFAIGTQISTYVLEHIAVPKFDTGNPIHTRLAALSQQAHRLAAAQTSEVSETSEVSAESWLPSRARWMRPRQSCGASPTASCGRYGGR